MSFPTLREGEESYDTFTFYTPAAGAAEQANAWAPFPLHPAQAQQHAYSARVSYPPQAYSSPPTADVRYYTESPRSSQEAFHCSMPRQTHAMTAMTAATASTTPASSSPHHHLQQQAQQPQYFTPQQLQAQFVSVPSTLAPSMSSSRSSSTSSSYHASALGPSAVAPAHMDAWPAMNYQLPQAASFQSGDFAPVAMGHGVAMSMASVYGQQQQQQQQQAPYLANVAHQSQSPEHMSRVDSPGRLVLASSGEGTAAPLVKAETATPSGTRASPASHRSPPQQSDVGFGGGASDGGSRSLPGKKEGDSAAQPLFRPHCCGECNFQFKRSADLNRHVKGVHERVRNHKCNYCESSFARRDSLTRHLENSCRGVLQAGDGAGRQRRRRPRHGGLGADRGMDLVQAQVRDDVHAFDSASDAEDLPQPDEYQYHGAHGDAGPPMQGATSMWQGQRRLAHGQPQQPQTTGYGYPEFEYVHFNPHDLKQ